MTGEIRTTWLDDLAQEYWRKLAPRVADSSQYELLEVLCASFSQYRQISQEIIGVPNSKQRLSQAQAFNQIRQCWKAIVWKTDETAEVVDLLDV